MAAQTVGQALAEAAAQGLPRLDAQWLLGHVLGQARSWLLAHDDVALTPAQQQAFVQGLQRRARGEPLAYVLGEWVFCGLTLEVDRHVLVPRPETEALVDWALQVAPPTARTLDMGTGSGAIALALKHARPAADVHASDLSPQALAVAQRNAVRLGLPLQWHCGSWWAALPADAPRFELVVSNPPYIAEGDTHLAALGHEPRLALTSGPSGLDALREIIRGAPAHLSAGGWLLLEHGHDQGGAVATLLVQQGFTAVETRPDLAGLPRISGGRWPG